MSWHDANAYAKWLSRETGKDYRLSTEAEWEKAARGESGRAYPWGDEFDTKKCNVAGSIGDTTPVGTYLEGTSPYGAMDMAGNVWEWCADWYDEAYYQKGENHNPKGPENGDARVVRGGSWLDHPDLARCAVRAGTHPDGRLNYTGVRCARTL